MTHTKRKGFEEGKGKREERTQKCVSEQQKKRRRNEQPSVRASGEIAFPQRFVFAVVLSGIALTRIGSGAHREEQKQNQGH